MDLGNVVAATLALLSLAAIGVVVVMLTRVMRLPANAPRRMLSSSQSSSQSSSPSSSQSSPSPSSSQRVAFLGASLTHGTISADFTARCAARAGVDAGDVINAGVNGDLAWNALQRLPQVMACKPAVVVVLVGSNDVMSSLDRKRAERYRRVKRLPQEPTLDWYAENIAAIVDGVVAAGARPILCTLPPLGEKLDDDVNAKVRAYNEAIALVGKVKDVAVVDVHAAVVIELGIDASHGIGARRAARDFWASDRLMVRSMFLRHILGWTWSRISARNGYRFLTDGIHINDDAADIVAMSVSSSLASALRSASRG